MKRISLKDWADLHKIKTYDNAKLLFGDGEIEYSYLDPVNGSMSVLVPEYPGDTEISKELQEELDFIQSEDRITLREFADKIGISYKVCYISYYQKGLIPNTFRDPVNGKITIKKTDGMFDAFPKFKPMNEMLYSIKEVSSLFGIGFMQLRYLAVEKEDIDYIQLQTTTGRGGRIFFTKESVKDYVQKMREFTSSVYERLDNQALFFIEDVADMFQISTQAVYRWGTNLIKGTKKIQNNITFESEGLRSFFETSGEFDTQINISRISPIVLTKFFQEKGIGQSDDTEKYSTEEIYKTRRMSLRDYAKNIKQSYYTLLDDFYNDKLPNSGQDEVSGGIFVLLPRMRDDIIDPEAIFTAFNGNIKRIRLSEWALKNNVLYNKAKVMAIQGKIPGALLDPVCHKYTVEIEGDFTGPTPYVRLDQDDYIKRKAEDEDIALSTFSVLSGLGMEFVKEKVKSGEIEFYQQGRAKMLKKESIESFFEGREPLVDEINNVLRTESFIDPEHLARLIDRDEVFLRRTAVRKKWLPAIEDGENFATEDVAIFLKEHDSHWSNDEKERMLDGVTEP